MRVLFTSLVLCAATARGVSWAEPPAPPIVLDLPRCLEWARAHSHRLRHRDDEVAAAGHRYEQAFARLLPRVGVTTRYSRVSHIDPATLHVSSPVPGLPAPAPLQLGEARGGRGPTAGRRHDAERDLTQARADEVQSHAAARIARARLCGATGG
jgi:outer membrane protein TolC